MFLIFLVTFLFGMILINFFRKLSERNNFLVDIPEGDILKIHKKNISLFGGLAMATVIVAFTIIFNGQSYFLKTIGFILGLITIFLLGFWDDLKWKHISQIKPFVKFFLLIMCTFTVALILWQTHITFDFLPVAVLSITSSFIYIFLVINSVNYQDGMDGLAGGLVFISLLGFIFLSLIYGNNFTLVISVISLGAVASFLVFNFPPTKIFMGDSGAYLLGFILAVLAISFSKTYNIYSVLGPMLIIGMPIIDGVFTNIRRLAAGKSIFLGDRSHFYDNLLQKGFSTKKTLAICYFLQILLVLIGIVLYQKYV